MGVQLRDMAPIQNLVYKYQKIDVFMTRMQYIMSLNDKVNTSSIIYKFQFVLFCNSLPRASPQATHIH